MTAEKAKMLILLGVGMMIFGTYKMSYTTYSAFAWEETQGVVVDFVLHNFTCGKQSKCFTLNVGYRVNGQLYMVESDKKYNHSRPAHLSGQHIAVLYDPEDPRKSRLTGEYGPQQHGPMFFILGIVFLIVGLVSKNQ